MMVELFFFFKLNINNKAPLFYIAVLQFCRKLISDLKLSSPWSIKQFIQFTRQSPAQGQDRTL